MKLFLPALAVVVSLLAAPAAAQDRDKGVEANERDDYAAALIELRPLAERGDADAQTNLAIMFENGLGVPQDYTEAVKWYQRAAEQGHVGAQNNLGVMYGNGRGVAQDHTEAAKWYQLAAEQGVAQPQDNLGVMYENGRGVPQDFVRAHMWFNLAAAQGLAPAIEHRDNLAKRMTPADLSIAQRMARERLGAPPTQQSSSTDPDVPIASSPAEPSSEPIQGRNIDIEFVGKLLSDPQSGMVIVTALLVVATFALVVVALSVMVVASRQKRALNIQADRIEATVGSARETAMYELRAYVHVDTAEINVENRNEPSIKVTARNFGRTPAMNVRHWIYMWTEKHPLIGPDILPVPPDDFQMATSVLPPDGHHQIPINRKPPPLPDIVASLLGTPEATLYVYGEIRYRDVFGEERNTKYRLVYGGSEPIDDKHLKPDVDGNEFT